MLGKGIHKNVSAADYHADPCSSPSLSSGIAKLLLERPPYWAWAAHPKLNPDYAPQPPKAAFDMGHAAHAMLLESGKGIVACNYDNWLTKDAKAAREDARAAGKTPVLVADYERTQEMARIAATMLLSIGIDVKATDNECTMIADVDGALCRARADIFADSLIIDYKTTARPLDQFDRQASKFGYDLQTAMYTRIALELGKKRDWLFLVQETTAPYPCQLFKPSGEFIEVGRRKFQEAHAAWKHHLETGMWPGYAREVQILDCMPWDLAEIDAENEERLLDGV